MKKIFIALKIVIFKWLFKKEISNMYSYLNDYENRYNKKEVFCVNGARYRFERLFINLEKNNKK